MLCKIRYMFQRLLKPPALLKVIFYLGREEQEKLYRLSPSIQMHCI